MSSSDPVADIEPDDNVKMEEIKLPTVSSPNSFFIYLLMVGAFLLFHRISWEAIKYLLHSRVNEQVISVLFYVWMIPIAGILGSIVVPSVGTSSGWLVAASSASSVPLSLAMVYTLLFGIRTDQPASI
jgi:hypothetical protein